MPQSTDTKQEAGTVSNSSSTDLLGYSVYLMETMIYIAAKDADEAIEYYKSNHEPEQGVTCEKANDHCYHECEEDFFADKPPAGTMIEEAESMVKSGWKLPFEVAAAFS